MCPHSKKPVPPHPRADRHISDLLIPAAVQADAGAQVVQIFDSWASQLSPQDFEIFSAPYIKQIIADVRKVPLIPETHLVWVAAFDTASQPGPDQSCPWSACPVITAGEQPYCWHTPCSCR